MHTIEFSIVVEYHMHELMNFSICNYVLSNLFEDFAS